MNWEALSAIGTIFSAVAALGIALFVEKQSHKKEQVRHIKEAIEKLLVPLRKELDEFSKSKWDIWYIGNRLNTLSEIKSDFPLQFYSLQNANPSLVKNIEIFEKNSLQFNNYQEESKASAVIGESIEKSFREFIAQKDVVISGNAGRLPGRDLILNSHWSGLARESLSGRASVTLYSLVLWKASLSDFISDRSVSTDSLSFTLSDLSFSLPFDFTIAEELLKKIEDDLLDDAKSKIINEYREKWKELYYLGNSLIKEIDQWLSSADKFGKLEIKQSKSSFWWLLRSAFLLIFIFSSAYFTTKELTPRDYTISFRRECSEGKCEKIIDSERTTIQKDIEVLFSTLERFDFFAKLTFLRFDLQMTNKSQLTFRVSEPKYERGVDVIIQCYLDGQSYDLYPGSGIVFKQKASIGNIIKELNSVQNILLNCSPAPQIVKNIIERPVAVAADGQIELIYNEERYHLKFLPDRWNYLLTAAQIIFITGILFGIYYELKKFIRRGF